MRSPALLGRYRQYVSPLFYYCLSATTPNPSAHALLQQSKRVHTFCHTTQFVSPRNFRHSRLQRSYLTDFHRRQMTTHGNDSTTSEDAEIEIGNNQSDLPDIDIDRLRDTASKIRKLLGYQEYAVSIFLVDDEDIQQMNESSRDINKPTDILSFPSHDCVTPGVLGEPIFGFLPDLTLGEVLIDVPYIMRTCEPENMMGIDDLGEYDDRGVAPALDKVSDAETRIHMLLVHGMLHLVGYDHIDDEDYELMVTKEDELLQQLGLPIAK